LQVPKIEDSGQIEFPKEFILAPYNFLPIYQMTNSGTGKRVIFTLDAVDIYDMQTNSRVAIGEVNHQFRIYRFSEFIEPNFALLLTHADESSRIWHERFEHLNFGYMQQLNMQ
jgi:hypothetical protein